ncbi:hypothetical protein [Nocardia niigatensis]
MTTLHFSIDPVDVPTPEPVALLAMFLVHPAVPSDVYVERLRELISAAIGIAEVTDFDEADSIPLDPLPGWFRRLSDPTSREGVRRYAEADLGDPWDPEEWISCFDPDLRRWSWWDVAIWEEGVAVWVDTIGEAHIPHGELLWALYVAGARKVDPLVMEYAEVWSGEKG